MAVRWGQKLPQHDRNDEIESKHLTMNDKRDEVCVCLCQKGGLTLQSCSTRSMSKALRSSLVSSKSPSGKSTTNQGCNLHAGKQTMTRRTGLQASRPWHSALDCRQADHDTAHWTAGKQTMTAHWTAGKQTMTAHWTAGKQTMTAHWTSARLPPASVTAPYQVDGDAIDGVYNQHLGDQILGRL